MHPDLYDRPPKCNGCGKTKYYVSNYMNGRNTKEMSCNCKGYVRFTRNPKTTVWEIHRKGSPYCWFRKDGSQRVHGDPDFKDADMEAEMAESNWGSDKG